MSERWRKETNVANYYGVLAIGVDVKGPFIELENYDGVWRWPVEMEVVKSMKSSSVCDTVYIDETDGRYDALGLAKGEEE